MFKNKHKLFFVLILVFAVPASCASRLLREGVKVAVVFTEPDGSLVIKPKDSLDKNAALIAKIISDFNQAKKSYQVSLVAIQRQKEAIEALVLKNQQLGDLQKEAIEALALKNKQLGDLQKMRFQDVKDLEGKDICLLGKKEDISKVSNFIQTVFDINNSLIEENAKLKFLIEENARLKFLLKAAGVVVVTTVVGAGIVCSKRKR